MGDQPPPPTPRSGKPAGWYKDPGGRYDWRYFDGAWSDEVQNEGDDSTYIEPVPSPRRSPATEDLGPPSTSSAAQATTTGLESAPGTQWWRRKLWKLPVWGWSAVGIAAIVGIATGAREPQPPGTDSGAATSAAAEATPAAPGATEPLAVGSPAEPNVSPAALDFIDADECDVETLKPDGTVGWFRCTRVNVDGDGATGVAYITEDSDPVAALSYAEAMPDYNENVAVLWNIGGGGVAYFPDNFDWPMFDVGPYPEELQVVDTDCAPFPEPNPDLCPASPAPVSGSETETSAGLTEIPAWSACRAYGDATFRYGWDRHNVLGMITSEIVNDRWFFKLEADVTNEFGTEAAGVVECTVSGTDDSPTVDSFIFY